MTRLPTLVSLTTYLLLSVLPAEAQPAPATASRTVSPAVVHPVARHALERWLSMDGEWEFKIDPAAIGERDGWYRQAMAWFGSRTIQTPGAWEAQGVGNPGSSQPGWQRMAFEAVDRPMFAAYTGTAWYRKTVTIPGDWAGRQIWLKIGGINSLGRIWVNGVFVTENYVYGGTYKVNITDLVTPGRPAALVVLVRNDIRSRRGASNSIRTYGGIFRSIELQATPDRWIDYAFAEPDLPARSVRLHITLGLMGSVQSNERLQLHAAVTPWGGGAAAGIAAQEIEMQPGVREFVLTVPVTNCRPWSPEDPFLYRAEITLLRNGQAVDGWIERFGIKQFEARGTDLYLNGVRYFLRGYGDDHTYPLTVSSPASRESHLRNLRMLKSYGFNFVRTHTHTENPEYYEAADEVGMMIQAELPYWAVDPTPMWGKLPLNVTHMSGGRADPLDDLETLITHYRRYVSLAIYSGGNDGHYEEELGRSLQALVRRRDPGRLWIAQDRDERPETDLSDLDSFSRMLSGDAFHLPLTEEEDTRPKLQHEFLSFSLMEDPRTAWKYTRGYAPLLTVEQARKRATEVGLSWEWMERTYDAGQTLQGLLHKIGLESARLDPRLDGYTLWLGLDWSPNTHNGLLDSFYDPKKTRADFFRQFNGPVAVLARAIHPHTGIMLLPFASPVVYNLGQANSPDGNRGPLNAFLDWPVYTSGETLEADWVVSNFSSQKITGARFTWKLTTPGACLARGDAATAVPAGSVESVGGLKVTLPEVNRPTTARLRAVLEPGGIANSWEVFLFPKPKPHPDTGPRIAATPGLYERLAPRYPGLIRAGTPEAAGARILITDDISDDAVAEALTTGKRVLALNLPGENLFSPPARLGNWFTGEQAGTAITCSPAFGGFPCQGFLAPPWMRLFDKAILLQPERPLPAVEPLIVGQGSRGPFVAAFQCRVGPGFLLATGLRLIATFPEAESLLDETVRYLLSDRPATPGYLDLGALRQWTAEARRKKVLLKDLNGLDYIVKATETIENYPGFLGPQTVLVARQTDGQSEIIWKTQVPREEKDGRVRFAWAGGMGWVTQPAGGSFRLFLNGKPLLDFDIAMESQVWKSADGRVTLEYLMEKPNQDREDTSGIMVLTVPAEQVTTAQPSELRVVGSPSGSMRFFGVYARPQPASGRFALERLFAAFAIPSASPRKERTESLARQARTEIPATNRGVFSLTRFPARGMCDVALNSRSGVYRPSLRSAQERGRS